MTPIGQKGAVLKMKSENAKVKTADHYVPKSVEEALTLICDVSCDYDGYEDSQNLKELIDEVSWYANCALRMIQGEFL